MPLAITGGLAIAAGILMYLGDGKLLTWVGSGLFLLALAGFTFFSLRAVR